MPAVPSLRTLIIGVSFALATFCLAGCKDESKQAMSNPSNAPAERPALRDVSVSDASVAVAASATSAAHVPAAPKLVNLAGLSARAFVIDKPRDDSKWIHLLNEVPDSIGITANGDAYGVVIELAAPATIERVRFTRVAELAMARHAQVQVSEGGPEGPWRTVFAGDLKPVTDKLDSRRVIDDIALERPTTARWLHVSWKGVNHDSGTISMGQFEALGMAETTEDTQLDVTGIYDLGRAFDHSDYVALRQEGATIRGCFGDGDVRGKGEKARVIFRKVSGSLEGTVEPNGYLAFTRGNSDKAWQGVVIFSPDGSRVAVLEFPVAADDRRTTRQSVHDVGRKVAEYQDTCPGLKSEQDALRDALEADRRVTLHGVNFDIDADTLRPESRPALDGVVKVVREHPDWRLAIEGHTDNNGSDAHNLDLSVRRAGSVRRYLIDAGVPADRLEAQGFGASRPLAPNDDPAGRAQNRRVEVVRR